MAKGYNATTVCEIMKLTHQIRADVFDIDYYMANVVDTEVFDYDMDIEQAKELYEDAKQKLTEVKNLIDSLII